MLSDLCGEPTAEYCWLEARLGITRATRAATLDFLLRYAREAGGERGTNDLLNAIGEATLREE